MNTVIGLSMILCSWPVAVCPGKEPKATCGQPWRDSQGRPSSRPGQARSSGPTLARKELSDLERQSWFFYPVHCLVLSNWAVTAPWEQVPRDQGAVQR